VNCYRYKNIALFVLIFLQRRRALAKKLLEQRNIETPPCNENQLDALFILSLFCQSASTRFGHICSPSSGGIMYVYNTYQLLYIHSIPPDDGLQICPKHVEVDWRNKLRINSASSWLLLHGCIEMHGQQNVKYRNAYSLVMWDSYDTQF
jgi:hypothetical protein